MRILWIILGLYILGEVAHFIRKTREKLVVRRSEENAEDAADIIRTERPKNEGLLGKV